MSETDPHLRGREATLFATEIADMSGNTFAALAEGRVGRIRGPRLDRVHIDLGAVIPAGLSEVDFTCGYAVGEGSLGPNNAFYVSWRSEQMASVFVIPQQQSEGRIHSLIVHRDQEGLMAFLTSSAGYLPDDVQRLLHNP